MGRKTKEEREEVKKDLKKRAHFVNRSDKNRNEQEFVVGSEDP
jgi:hypothetical protein